MISPAHTFPTHVFISYSRRNIDYMVRIQEALTGENIPVWTDEKLAPGTASWKDTIERALQAAYCVVVLMSPPAKASEWVERELDYAYILQRPIFPVLIDGTQRDAVPFEIVNIQYVDLRTDFDRGIQQLVQSIQAHLAQFRSEVQAEPASINHPSYQPTDKIPGRIAPRFRQIIPRMPGNFDLFTPVVEPEQFQTVSLTERFKKLQRIVYWYFLEPRKFRLLRGFTTDTTTRYLHASVIALAFTGLFVLPYLRFYGDINNIILLLGIIYGMMAFVQLAVPYRTRQAFFVSILSTMLLVGVLIVIILVPWLLALRIALILEPIS